MRLPSLAATLSLLLAASSAVAEPDVTSKLTSFETEARALGTDLPRPNQFNNAAGQRRLVDAEVAYSTGDYDTAALVLFDIAGKAQGADKEAATYYLAESLYQKGDKGAARAYFQELANSSNAGTKYYQASLQRIVEIAIAQNDTTAGDEAIAALESSSPRTAVVPYIHGKYAFAQGKHDDAINFFNNVPKGSEYELQALYFASTAQVAKQNLAEALKGFSDLVNRKPKSSNDRRVIELSQLALGRMYYERDEPAKAIDAYLLVDRRSDLFPDALYEVAWVYVKSKQYDKALRALELLEQSDPSSTKTPTVRILEGNLRIRKAQSIRQAQIAGTLNTEETSDPGTEYDKASKLFNETHDLYLPSYTSLAQMVDGNLDPAGFIEQIAGRSAHVFQASAPLPEAAAQWLRDQPEVQRVVSVETDLGDVQTNIAESEATIGRLEGVLAAGDRLTVYPALSARRMRIAAMQSDLIKIRNDLADQELRLVDSSGELAQLSANRKQLAQQYTALGDPEQAYSDRVTTAHLDYDKIDDAAVEIEGVIDSTQAMSVALRKYALEATPPLSDDQKKTAGQSLDDAAKEAQAIEDELVAVHREIVLGKDLSGVGDEGLKHARELRKQLRAAQDAEHRVLAGFASASRDRGRSQNLASLGDRATRLVDTLDQLDNQIDAMVGQGLEEVKVQLAQERKNLADYKQELAEYDTEARTEGATVLAASLKDVKAKLYDVIVRTDLGAVDVSWSQKEDSDDDYKRLTLARSRELKQLKDEFRDVLEETTPKPGPKKPAVAMPAPTEGTAPTTSPDKQTGNPGDTRVKPVGDQPKSSTQPTVKPDEPKKGTQPKKGGSK